MSDTREAKDVLRYSLILAFTENQRPVFEIMAFLSMGVKMKKILVINIFNEIWSLKETW